MRTLHVVPNVSCVHKQPLKKGLPSNQDTEWVRRVSALGEGVPLYLFYLREFFNWCVAGIACVQAYDQFINARNLDYLRALALCTILISELEKVILCWTGCNLPWHSVFICRYTHKRLVLKLPIHCIHYQFILIQCFEATACYPLSFSS